MYERQVRQKSSHELAYLIILLVLVVGIFLFAMIYVTSLFNGLLRRF